jgi:DNA-binding YbaB/EbfC family protein
MFDMFKLMGLVPRIKSELEQLQQRLGQLSAEGDAGAGMVRVRVNGKMEVVSCIISEEALRLNDREMLEDLVRGAVNQALDRIRQQSTEERAKMVSSLGLPPGMGVPGLDTPGG